MSGAHAGRRTGPDVLPLRPALLVLHIGTLAVTGLHRGVLGGGMATVVWTGGFTLGAVLVTTALAATLVRRGRVPAGV